MANTRQAAWLKILVLLAGLVTIVRREFGHRNPRARVAQESAAGAPLDSSAVGGAARGRHRDADPETALDDFHFR